MSPFEVPEGPYTIEKIMESIRAQVIEPAQGAGAEGNGGGASAGGPGAAGTPAPVEPPRPIIEGGGPVSRLVAQLELLRQRQSLDPAYRIGSHRAVVGPILDFVKRIIHWGARPYTDAIRARQEAFNESVLQALREVSLQFESNIGRLEGHDQRFDGQQARLEEHKAYLESYLKTIHELQHTDVQLSERINDTVAGMMKLSALTGEHNDRLQEHGRALDGLAGRADETDRALEEAGRRVETLYDRYDLGPLFAMATAERRLDVLDHTRGTVEDIRCRQYQYMELFEGAPGQVLDIGCGRGELLKMLHVHGIECWGVDTDPVMVEACRKQGLYVQPQDALTALKGVAPASLGGIFAAQVIEHFFPGDVVRFLALARRTMARGGRIVLETLNPASLAVQAKSYWRDLEHKQMIHPEYLRGMLEMAGFEAVEVRYLSPFGEAERLPELPPAAELGLTEAARQALQERLDRLNELLYGMQDYVVIARQGEPAAVPPEAPAP